MADRIAVMNQGRIVQVDTPEALYRSPRTTFVAEFIDVGTVLRGRVTASGPVLEVEADDMVVRGETPSWYESGRAVAAVLPHDRVRILGPNTDDPAPPGVLRGTRRARRVHRSHVQRLREEPHGARVQGVSHRVGGQGSVSRRSHLSGLVRFGCHLRRGRCAERVDHSNRVASRHAPPLHLWTRTGG